MKKYYQYIFGGVLSLFLVIACTKEITNDLVSFFKLEISETTIEAFVDTPKAVQLGIKVGGEIKLGDYQLKYNVTEGEGYYTIDSERVEEDQFVDLSGAENTISYVGTTVGTHKVVITVKDLLNREQDVTLTYTINDKAFTLDVTASPEFTYIDGVIDLNIKIEEISAATYELKYVFGAETPDVSGTGAITVDGTSLDSDTLTSIPVGDSTWNFEGLTKGTVEVLFTATSSLGIVVEKKVQIEVNDTPDFTFTTDLIDEEMPVNGFAKYNAKLVEVSGESTYTMTFTTTKAGSIDIGGETYIEGDVILVSPGGLAGTYKGAESGEHVVTFTIINANTVPIEKTSSFSVLFKDPDDVIAPIITLVGADPQIIQKGAAYEELGATTDDGSEVGIDSSAVDITVPGSYTVTYTATDASDNTASVTRTVVVNDPPVAVINATPIEGEAPLTVSFKNDTSTDSDGMIVSSSWNLGDNTNIEGEFPYNITHTYTDPGEYRVLLDVNDNNNGGARVEVTITVTTSIVDTTPPVITLTGSDSVVLQLGQPPYEDPGATANDNVDGDITDKIVVVSNVDTSIAGTYQITYNVTDAAGNAAEEKVRTLTVIEPEDTAPPVIALTGSSSQILQLGDAYTEEGASATDDVDGVVDVTISGVVDVNVAGTYTITYTATDSSNNTASVTRTIIVNDPPVAVIDATPTTGTAPLTVSFNNNNSSDTDGTIALSDWSLGDGTNNTAGFPHNISHTYNTPGEYRVELQVTDNNGGIGVSQVVIIVRDETPPVITIIGSTDISIELGAIYVDAKATATDNVDGDITDNIVTTSNVNTDVLGTYEVRYNVTDAAGNAAEEVIRTVRVVKPIIEECECPPGQILCDRVTCECVSEQEACP